MAKDKRTPKEKAQETLSVSRVSKIFGFPAWVVRKFKLHKKYIKLEDQSIEPMDPKNKDEMGT